MFGKIDVSRDTLSHKVEAWIRLEEEYGLSIQERTSRRDAVKKINNLNHMEEVIWLKKI